MKKPPTITLLKSDLSQQGGLEKYTQRIISAFIDKGCPVTLLTSREPTIFSSPLLKVHSQTKVPSLSYFRIEAFDKFCSSYIKDHPTDLVFGLDRNRYQTHIRAGNGVHAAYLEQRKKFDGFFKRNSYRFNPLHRSLLEIEKTSFEAPDLRTLITNSQMVKEEILRFYNVDAQKVHVVHNGVEWHEMAQDFAEWPDKKIEIATKLKIDPSLHQLAFIGHNYQRKGLRELLFALSLLPERNFHLSVVGKEKKIEDFQALVAKLHLEKNVSFFGKCSNIRPFYQLADTLVIPSFYDPFANVTVEALAMGVYTVSSKKNGGHEIINNACGAIIEDLSHVESITEALSKAFTSPKTIESAKNIRNSVEHLDFSKQLSILTELCLP